MTTAPRLPDIGVLAVVPDYFDEPWQSRHQILTRLSSYFHVVWIAPMPEWRQRLLHPRKAGSPEPLDDSARGFVVYEPPAWLPVMHRPVALARRLARARLMRARRILLRRGCQTVVVSLWRPTYDRVLPLVPHDAVAYHIDDEYAFARVEGAADPREMRLIETADVVTVTSPGLVQRKGGINPKTVLVPNGVDYQQYAAPAPEPGDLASIPHPRIGYSGYLKAQLDWDLLRQLITSHRQWHFVFVGPVRVHDGTDRIVRELARKTNAHFIPSKAQRDLAAYPQHFDACVMPYVGDDYTKYIYPLKLHEYLAAGRPVIGTRLLSLEKFADVVALATTPAEWSAAIAAALKPEAQSESCRAARQAIARAHDWSTITRQMASAIALGLGPATRARLEQI